MHIREILAAKPTCLSFEFFPPKTEQASLKLLDTIADIQTMDPAYVSITYGAGGTTQALTHDLVVKINNELNVPTVAHLTCVAATKLDIIHILDRYHAAGIRNIMALRGDTPKTMPINPVPNDFAHAADLVALIKDRYPSMGIGVAGFPEGHPGCPNRLLEMTHLKAKVDAGADYICTQLFFDNRDFYDFQDRCRLAGITVPIVAGIMPITSLSTLNRIAALAEGARFPATLLKSLNRAKTDTDLENIGIHWAAEQVRDLLNNSVRGIHFYTFNQSNPALKICKTIGISHTSQLNQVA